MNEKRRMIWARMNGKVFWSVNRKQLFFFVEGSQGVSYRFFMHRLVFIMLWRVKSLTVVEAIKFKLLSMVRVSCLSVNKFLFLLTLLLFSWIFVIWLLKKLLIKCMLSVQLNKVSITHYKHGEVTLMCHYFHPKQPILCFQFLVYISY